jgi:hypothetical protein
MSDISERPSNKYCIDQKLEYLEDANQILSESINVDSHGNWFAYTTRMQVNLDIADTVIKHNLKKAKSSLENAKKDGHHCFKSKNNRHSLKKGSIIVFKLSSCVYLVSMYMHKK